MADYVNTHCRLCVANHRRNRFRNREILAGATADHLVLSGTVHQHYSRGAKAFEIVAATRQIYIPGMDERTNCALDVLIQSFVDLERPISHLLCHMAATTVVAIPTAAGVMLVRLSGGPMRGAMRDRFVYTFGDSTPYYGGAEGADSMLHVAGVLERPGCTRPLHIAHRNIEVVGYLSPASAAYSKIMATQQVTTSVKQLVLLTDIKPTLAEAMAVAVAPSATISGNSSACSSSASATEHSACSSSASATEHQLCKCYAGHETKQTSIKALLASALTIHGPALAFVAGCECPICIGQIGLCSDCRGVLWNEEDEEECV